MSVLFNKVQTYSVSPSLSTHTQPNHGPHARETDLDGEGPREGLAIGKLQGRPEMMQTFNDATREQDLQSRQADRNFPDFKSTEGRFAYYQRNRSHYTWRQCLEEASWRIVQKRSRKSWTPRCRKIGQNWTVTDPPQPMKQTSRYVRRPLEEEGTRIQTIRRATKFDEGRNATDVPVRYSPVHPHTVNILWECLRCGVPNQSWNYFVINHQFEQRKHWMFNF